jgi:hypothetical protein
VGRDSVDAYHRFRRIEAEASRGSAEDFTGPATTTTVLDRLSRYQAHHSHC